MTAPPVLIAKNRKVCYNHINICGGNGMLSFYLSMVETDNDKNIVSDLFKSYEKIMFSVAYKILGSKSDAEDAVHEAFVRIINKIEKISQISYDERGYYVVIIVKNISLDMLRKRKRLSETDIDDFYGMQDDSSVEDEAIQHAEYGELRKAMSQLNDTDYEILYLKFFMEYSTSEISGLLGISQNAAKQRAYIAKRNLAKLLKEKGAFYEQ